MKTLDKAVVTTLGTLLASSLSGALLQAQTATTPQAYVVIEFTVKDAEGFKSYGQQAPATVAKYGGKFFVRGARSESLKGDVGKGPYVVLAFDSLEKAKQWAFSSEYAALIPLRDKAADTRAFIVEGARP